MKKKINNISLTLRPSKNSDFLNFVTHLSRWLLKRKKTLLFLEKEQEIITKSFKGKISKGFSFTNEEEFFNKPDLIITLGGDGTLIGTARHTKVNCPIFGVNMGRLGFITEFTKTDIYESLESILKGKYSLFTIPLFKIEIYNKDKLQRNDIFINDLVLSKNDIARMFTMSVEANSEHVYHLSGDGLIISSTTGSTAYSMAAGGPIVHPDVKGLILTPICPHSLTHRPIVLSDTTELSVAVPNSDENIIITLDGQKGVQINKGEQIFIKKFERKKVSLIRNFERNYFQTLKEKFVHGRRNEKI